MPEPTPRRIRFVQAELKHVSPAVCMARVELERRDSGGTLSTAVGDCPEVEELKAAAKAAADAVMQMVGNDPMLEVRGVETVTVFGQAAVAVNLGIKRQDHWQPLVGFCMAGQDPARAAVLAVLNATNRVLTHT
jgi:hypothetical protein